MGIRSLLLLLSAAALLAAAAAPAHAQVQVRGTVLDDSTGLPIPRVRIEIFDYFWNRLATRITDEQGTFEYPLRRPGEYRVRATRVGYAPVRSVMLRTGAHSFVNVEVRLKSDAVLLAPLVVTATSGVSASPVLSNFEARRRSAVGGTFFTRADIERLRPVNVSDLVTTVPGLHIQTSGRGTSRAIYSSRNGGGMRQCPAQIYVDGFLINPRTTTGEVVGMNLDEAVLPQAVEAIEVYRGMATVPAEFLSIDSRCAVIAVWTRRGG